MSKEHGKKGHCKKEFCKKGGNDNKKGCPHPKTDAAKPTDGAAPKKCHGHKCH